jgi:hypothetical protein
MKVKQHTILYLLFFLFVISVPFNSLYETIAHLQGTLPWDKTYPLTPIYLKLFKDMFLVGSIVMVLIAGGFRFLRTELMAVYVFLVFVLVFSAISFSYENFLTTILGIRSYLVVAFILLGYYYYDFDSLRVYPLLRFVLYVELAVQVLQFFYAPRFYGKSFYGYSIFNPGTFLIPSTMASFAILVHYYAVKKEDTLTAALALFSVFLSRSATAWVVIILYYIIVLAKKRRLGNDVVLAGLAAGALLIFLNIDSITGRASLLNNLQTRIDIFTSSLFFPFGKGFGLGSGATVLSQVKGAVIADSTITSLVVNFGWCGLIIYFLFLCGSLQVFDFRNLLLLSFIGFSFTMIVFEMTPFIQFLFFEWGKAIRVKADQPSLIPGT